MVCFFQTAAGIKQALYGFLLTVKYSQKYGYMVHIAIDKGEYIMA